MTLEEERLDIARQRQKLEWDKKEFTKHVEIEDRRLEQQQRLFDMKFRILEEELIKLASEKQHVEKQREFYKKVNDYQQRKPEKPQNVVKGEMFFTGVGNKQSLKKRYKDLIKIYHPDNLDGDHDTIQEINREYDHLSKVFV